MKTFQAIYTFAIEANDMAEAMKKLTSSQLVNVELKEIGASIPSESSLEYIFRKSS